MKVSIFVSGTEAKSEKESVPSAYGKQCEITGKKDERSTVVIGEVIREIITEKLPKYRKYKPVIIVDVDDKQLIIDKIPSASATLGELFTAVNKPTIDFIMGLTTTTEQLIDPTTARNTDKVYNSLCKGFFGHKGDSINIAHAQQQMKTKYRDIKRFNAYAKDQAKTDSDKAMPQSLIAWEKAKAEERKLKAAAKLLTEKTSAK
jgi:hypothetical protein